MNPSVFLPAAPDLSVRVGRVHRPPRSAQSASATSAPPPPAPNQEATRQRPPTLSLPHRAGPRSPDRARGAHPTTAARGRCLARAALAPPPLPAGDPAAPPVTWTPRVGWSRLTWRRTTTAPRAGRSSAVAAFPHPPWLSPRRHAPPAALLPGVGVRLPGRALGPPAGCRAPRR